MRILLTGASGFLGRNFILRAPKHWSILAVYRNDTGFPEFLSALGRENIRAARCDLADAEQTSGLVQEFGSEWECCLYLSAKVDIPWSTRELRNDLLLNACPLLNLLDSIEAKRLIYFSSGAVYDGLRGQVSAASNIAPTLPYAISKMACERYVEFYHQRRKSVGEYLNVRFFGAYGPYEAAHKIYTRLVRAFAFDGRTGYTIYGDGRNLIDAMYIDDAIDAIQRMLEGSYWNTTIDLASGHPVTIEELVRQAAAVLGVDALQLEKSGVAHENIEFRASTEALKTHYGFEPKIGLSDGILRLRDFLASEQSGQ